MTQPVSVPGRATNGPGLSNVIILTSGLSGSSVLTGLIARAGYWMGDATIQKPGYDTHENHQLVKLNMKLFEEVGYTGNYTLTFSPELVAKLRRARELVDPTPYAEFLAQCNLHRPWIWKDPRLSYTIHFWKDLLDLASCKFIFLTRDALQTWISSTLRRQIQTYRYHRQYHEGVEGCIRSFFAESAVPYLHLQHEDLILDSDRSVARVNAYLGTSLSRDDLTAVYTKPLGRSPRSRTDLLKAILIYAKNYRERVG